MHIPDGNAKDLEKECREYEEKIKAAGGVELFIGGMKIRGLEVTSLVLLVGKGRGMHGP